MLVLTRKMREEIRIGDQITVTILRVKGNSVRIGIDAPREVQVKRGELLEEHTNSPTELHFESTSIDPSDATDSEEEPALRSSHRSSPAPLSHLMSQSTVALGPPSVFG